MEQVRQGFSPENEGAERACVAGEPVPLRRQDGLSTDLRDVVEIGGSLKRLPVRATRDRTLHIIAEAVPLPRRHIRAVTAAFAFTQLGDDPIVSDRLLRTHRAIPGMLSLSAHPRPCRAGQALRGTTPAIVTDIRESLRRTDTAY